MNDCKSTDIQEMLPDLLHGTLPAGDKTRVEAHLASCGECREDLEVLRAVKTAAVFVPSIDVNRIVTQLPPYQVILPTVERPARSRTVSWLAAAAAAVVIAVAGSLFMQKDASVAQRTALGGDTAVENSVTLPAPLDTLVREPIGGVSRPSERTYALALNTDVNALSDGSLVQLMDDMTQFDGLPAWEPEPMISVDSVENIGQE